MEYSEILLKIATYSKVQNRRSPLNKCSSWNTVVHVTIRVGTLGYDVVPAICDTCQKTSYGSYIVSQKGILLGICGLATIVNFTPKKHKIGKIW